MEAVTNQVNNQLVSVILPVFNCAKYIKKSIYSILSQTHSKIELIIVNDGSTDNTDEIIKTFSDNRIKYISKRVNIGKVAAVNQALNYVTGDFIAMQDADDWSEPNRISEQLKLMNSHPNIVVSFTGYNLIGYNKHGAKVRETDKDLRNEFLHLGFSKPGDILIPTSCATMMVRVEVIKKIGGYSTFFSRRICEDIHWVSRILRFGGGATLQSNLYNYNYGREGSYTYDTQSNLNPSHLYGASLVRKVIELENQTNIKVETLTISEQLELELNACKDALAEKTLLFQTQFNNYKNSTAYKVGSFITFPFQIIRKILKKFIK